MTNDRRPTTDDQRATSLHIHPTTPNDREWIEQFIAEQWGSSLVVVHDTLYYPHTLPGFIAVQGDKKVGLITYTLQGNNCEIVSLNSLCPSIGIGTALIEAVKQVARQASCRRVWLITTNDNLHALRFYQKRGFALVAVYPNALKASRKIKPEIPQIGNDGIPLRDEIELELIL